MEDRDWLRIFREWNGDILDAIWHQITTEHKLEVKTPGNLPIAQWWREQDQIRKAGMLAIMQMRKMFISPDTVKVVSERIVRRSVPILFAQAGEMVVALPEPAIHHCEDCGSSLGY